MHEGNDVTVIACGLASCTPWMRQILKETKDRGAVLNMHHRAANRKLSGRRQRYRKIITVENHSTGGLGSAVASNTRSKSCRLKRWASPTPAIAGLTDDLSTCRSTARHHGSREIMGQDEVTKIGKTNLKKEVAVYADRIE